jgi:hypothetical protein
MTISGRAALRVAPHQGEQPAGQSSTPLALDPLRLDATFDRTGFPCAVYLGGRGLAEFLGLLAQRVELLAQVLKFLDTLAVGPLSHSFQTSTNNAITHAHRVEALHSRA